MSRKCFNSYSCPNTAFKFPSCKRKWQICLYPWCTCTRTVPRYRIHVRELDRENSKYPATKLWEISWSNRGSCPCTRTAHHHVRFTRCSQIFYIKYITYILLWWTVIWMPSLTFL
jgi:hypothetical protein